VDFAIDSSDEGKGAQKNRQNEDGAHFKEYQDVHYFDLAALWRQE
jgi:hypothetical protein